MKINNLLSNNYFKDCLSYLIGFSLIFIIFIQGAYELITVDTLYKIEISKMMLNSKMIYKDLFEVNHPMPTYLIFIPVFIASKFSWLNEVTTTKIFLNLLCLISVILTHKVMILSDEYKDKSFRFIHIITLFYVTFIVPSYNEGSFELGQKTHLFFILFLPFFHSLILSDKTRKQHPYLMAIIGIYAGIGLCIKIYYFAIAVILEIGRIINKKSIKSAFRIENFTIAAVAIIFLLSILIFTPQYITQIIPTAKYAYVGYSSFNSTRWIYVLIAYLPHYILILVLTTTKTKFSNYKSLLKLAIAATIASIFLQVSRWGHASIPTIGFLILLVSTIITDIVSNTLKNFSKPNFKFKNQDFANILVVIVTLLFIFESLILKNYHQQKNEYYETHNINSFINLSKKYQKYGGAHFITNSFQPGLYSWIYGDFSLQTYYYSAYILKGLNYYEKNKLSTKSQAIKDDFNQIFNKVRQQITNDLKEQRPALIVVERGFGIYEYSITKENKNNLKSHNFIKILSQQDYIEILNRNKQFKEIFENNYQLQQVITSTTRKNHNPIYEVYIRKDLTNL